VWYKFSEDYVKKILHNNSKAEDNEQTLEENITEDREKDQILPAEILRQYYYSKDPNRYFSNGQGGTYRMQEGRDLPWNASPDNFINTNDWNS
jgi:hypothetical protein